MGEGVLGTEGFWIEIERKVVDARRPKRGRPIK
jgi:hypothetical protein